MKSAASTETTKRSAFGAWFKEQFGAMPNEAKRTTLGMKIRNLEGELHYLRIERSKQDYLADSFKAALYAWNAKQ